METLPDLMKDILVTDLGFRAEDLDGETPMVDLGIDSVSLVELKVVMQQRLGIRIGLELLSLDDPLDALARKVGALVPAEAEA